MKPVVVYDGHTRKRLAYLQNAYDISYTKPINALWTASFSMPYSDEKNQFCEPFNLVELWDVDGGNGDKYVGLFRIMPRLEEALGVDAYISYELEHVLSTLLDDVMLGWHEIGNLGTFTPQVLAYILDRQNDRRWVLEVCEYSHQYLYGWQDENLLSALYSVVKPFSETDYYWDFDTTTFPWRLRLKQTKKEPVADIRYRKNISGITRTSDPSNLTTRLYCYGYGEGDNKLGIANVNDGIPYLESANVAKYGIITQIWTDERFTIEESLKATGEAMLKKLEEPQVTYDIDIQIIAEAANLNVGDAVRVVYEELDECMIVQEISKKDVSGAPRSGIITLGKGTVDVGESMANLAEKQRISETYAQGAESIFTDSFYDNADSSNPTEITFTIPENAVHVNEINFSARLTSFRAYSKATQGGGARTQSTSGGGSSDVTSDGGGSSTQSSSSGGSSTQSSSSGGGVNTSSGLSYTQPDSSASSSLHNHGLSRNARIAISSDGETVTGTETWVWSGAHEHSVNIPHHNHTVTIPSHKHTVTIPSHTHDVSIPSHTHAVTLPDHTHQIEYGIYKGPSASSMSIYLDDVLVGTYNGSVNNVNLIAYMSKNANGNIMRGQHTIQIVPNGLTRIECAFQIRLFTNAHGGGQY